VNLFLTVPFAYALSNPDLPGRKFFITMALIPFLFNAGLIPTYLVVQKMSLIDTYWAVILPGGINIYNLLVMKSFFEGLPDELKEAARLDGANELQVLWHVVLPLSKPILLTVGLWYAVGHWNEFFNAILYLNDAKLQPLPLLLRNILLAANINEYVEYDAFSSAPVSAFRAASVFLTMLPIIIIYPRVQRYFTKGTLLGGVKQ
jgi:putative aldouronate transport system permease protein